MPDCIVDVVGRARAVAHRPIPDYLFLGAAIAEKVNVDLDLLSSASSLD